MSTKLEEALLLVQALKWQTERYMWEGDVDEVCRSCGKTYYGGTRDHYEDCEVHKLILRAEDLLKDYA